MGLDYWMAPERVVRPAGTPDHFLLFVHGRGGASRRRRARPDGAASWLVWWLPGWRHEYGDGERPWVHSWIHGTGAAFERWARQARTGVWVALGGGVAEELWVHWGQLAGQVRRNPAPFLVANALEGLLYLAAAASREPRTGPRVPEAYLRARQAIDRDFAGRVSMADLARACSVTPNHFSTAFRAHFGARPRDYLVGRRLAEAKWLMRQEHRSLADLAAAVGYADYAQFCRLFRKHEGVSPRELRRKLCGAAARTRAG